MRATMIEPTKDIETPTADRDLAFQFFAFFSRFEYSLKRSNFLRASDKAEPNWDTYANTLRGRFDAVQDQRFQAAVAFLLAEPPKTQIVSGNDLGWKNTVQGAGEYKERYVLRLISVVRNNLFHGGKYPYPFGPVDDAARDRRLLEAAISILKQCLDLSETVRTKFEDKA
jgi:hypothetical protein